LIARCTFTFLTVSVPVLGLKLFVSELDAIDTDISNQTETRGELRGLAPKQPITKRAQVIIANERQQKMNKIFSNEQSPSVSVVIPTRGRSQMVLRAVESVLAQTYAPEEIIVVIDGPDPETKEALLGLHRKQVKVIELPTSSGGAVARNTGITVAVGTWIALLDDDDEWLPEKLASQMDIARRSTAKDTIIACKAIVNRTITTEVWPHRRPSEEEDLSEYIFCRSSLGQGTGLLITSMLLAPRKLFLQVPFDPGVRRHQDSDWILRATKEQGAVVQWAWQPLLIFNLEFNRQSVSRSGDAGPSFKWLSKTTLLTPKARAFFIATQIAPRVGLLSHPLLVLRAIAEFATCGYLSASASALFAVLLLTSGGMRGRTISLLDRIRHKARVTCPSA
jgi:glycosyltransferase involved in cell wall biosynthesis